jgi:dethiobiotin synthetase
MILVVGLKLGCLNHALLTVEAIQARGLSLAGWIACQPRPAMAAVDENILALKARIPAPALGTLPYNRRANLGAFAKNLFIDPLC